MSLSLSGSTDAATAAVVAAAAVAAGVVVASPDTLTVPATAAVDAAMAAAIASAQGLESKKRRARSASNAAAGGAEVGAGTPESAEEDEEEGNEAHEFTEEDESMQDVMAKMKEVTDANAAQFTQTPEKRMQLFDSKRMSRVSFNSWFEFDAYFEMYMQDTFQPFRMRSSCSVEAYRRNQQKVMMTNKNSRGRRIEFPDSAIHHHRIYMCTHAMKARCRGATTRPGQKYRGIGCIAKINVKISPSDNPSKYMVIVTDQVRSCSCKVLHDGADACALTALATRMHTSLPQVVTHNHPISREIYEAYPDVLLKTMRRSQIGASMLGRQGMPKFETPAQTQKYERALNLLTPLAESMARLSDDEYEVQLAEVQKVYANSIAEHNTV